MGWATAVGVLGGGWVAQLVAEALSGLILSFDLFLPHFLRYFSASPMYVALTAAVVQGPAQLLGPVSSWLTERWGARAVVMGCGVVGALGLAAGSACYAVWQLVIATSFLGIAIGLSSVPIVTATSFHFRGRYRNALTALATTGGALGAVLFPLLIQGLLDSSPWQYTLTILSCIFLQLVVCGALLPSGGLGRGSGRSRTVDSLKPDIIGSIASIREAVEKTDGAASAGPRRRRLALPAFLCACFLWALGCYMFDILPLRLAEEGFTGHEIALLLTLQACGYFPGRVAAAGVVWLRSVDVVGVFSATLALQGAAVLVSSLDGQTFASYAACVGGNLVGSRRGLCMVEVVTVGLGYGLTTALVPAVVLELVGLRELNHAFGLQLFVEGIAGCLGAPLAGLLSERRWGRLSVTYATAGLVGLSSSLLLLPFHWPLSRLCDRRPSGAELIPLS